jgi:uncharacterized protein
MNIVFDLSHPAHINFFKNAIYFLHAEGHYVMIFGLRRGKVPDIIYKEFPGYNIKLVGRHRNNIWSIIFEANIQKTITLFSNLLFKKVDIGVSVGSFTLGACLKLLNKKNLQFDDDPESSQNLFFERITADEIHIPPIYKGGNKFVIFNALKEWAYLSPKYFIPNPGILNYHNLRKYEYYFFREVSAGSLNYMDQGLNTVASFLEDLDKRIQVVFSLEDKSKRHLYPQNWIILEEPVSDIHSIIYFSKAVVSSGDSMAREGAMLGRPSIYCGKRSMKANDFIREKGLFYQLQPNEIPGFLKKIEEQGMEFPDQEKYRYRLQKEWDDVTEHIIDSIKRMTGN